MKTFKLDDPQTLDTLPTSGKIYFGKMSTLEVVSHEHVQYFRQYVRNFTTSRRAKQNALKLFVRRNNDLVWSYSATPKSIEA